MSIRTVSAGVIAIAFGLAPVSAFAGKPPVTKGNAHPPTASRAAATTPKSTGPKAPTAKASKPAPTTHGNPHTTTKSAPAASRTTTSGTTTTTTLNPIAQKIASKPNLSTKVQTMLPKGMTLEQASLGFKNQGQFIAALHVSQNLGIPFADLKTAMTGIDPTLPPDAQPAATSTLSLGQAIQKLRPSADADAAAGTAERQASTDLGTTTTPKKTSHK